MPDSPTITDQIKNLTEKEALANQVDQIEYGTVVFEVRAGRVYRVGVTSSFVFNQKDMGPQRKLLHSSRTEQ